jgi:hypothetical protein
MIHARRAVGLAAVLFTVVACTPEQREKVDSAAGAAESVGRTVLSVIDVDMGRHAGADKKISDKTDTFAPSDTIFASVHMSGTAKDGAVVGRWTFPDGSVVNQNAEKPTTEDDRYLAFFIAKPGGLAPGKYTFNVLVDGRELRSKDVTVK